MHIGPHHHQTPHTADRHPGATPGSFAFPRGSAPPVTPTSPIDRVTLSPEAAARTRSTLVAARVNTPASEDLSAPSPEPRTADAPAGSFPLYRHPADRNAAATSIFAGRNLDVTA